MSDKKKARRKTKKSQPEIIKLPEEYILKNRYTKFLLDEGKRRMPERMLLCWYIGQKTGRLLGAYWNPNDEHPYILAYNIKGEHLFFDDRTKIDTWDNLFSYLRQSPKSHYTPSMAYVFSACADADQRDKGKIIQFPKAV